MFRASPNLGLGSILSILQALAFALAFALPFAFARADLGTPLAFAAGASVPTVEAELFNVLGYRLLPYIASWETNDIIYACTWLQVRRFERTSRVFIATSSFVQLTNSSNTRSFWVLRG